MNYKDITLEECFVKYHENKIASECNADNKEIEFVEE